MVAEIRTPISTSPESRSTTPQITDWFALALCPLICLDAIIWPAGTVTLRDSSGQDGRGGKTLDVARSSKSGSPAEASSKPSGVSVQEFPRVARLLASSYWPAGAPGAIFVFGKRARQRWHPRGRLGPVTARWALFGEQPWHSEIAEHKKHRLEYHFK
jgi:hypothetical protein